MYNKSKYKRLFRLKMDGKTADYVLHFLTKVDKLALVKIETKTVDELLKLIQFKLYEHSIMFIERIKEEYKEHPNILEEKLKSYFSWLARHDYFFIHYTQWIWEMVEKIINDVVCMLDQKQLSVLDSKKSNIRIRKIIKWYLRYDTLTTQEYTMEINDRDLF